MKICMAVGAITVGPVVVVPKGVIILNLSKKGHKSSKRRGRESVIRKDLKTRLGGKSRSHIAASEILGDTTLDLGVKELRYK